MRYSRSRIGHVGVKKIFLTIECLLVIPVSRIINLVLIGYWPESMWLTIKSDFVAMLSHVFLGPWQRI